jgi:hypothetical protein
MGSPGYDAKIPRVLSSVPPEVNFINILQEAFSTNILVP